MSRIRIVSDYWNLHGVVRRRLYFGDPFNGGEVSVQVDVSHCQL
ncbi:hypothetical protein [Hyphomonas adhaerens]|nr:hypothetical protein [Hyphomonas adhaerens]